MDKAKKISIKFSTEAEKISSASISISDEVNSATEEILTKAKDMLK